eukprot:c19728_g1_i1 orf=21-302(-)
MQRNEQKNPNLMNDKRSSTVLLAKVAGSQRWTPRVLLTLAPLPFLLPFVKTNTDQSSQYASSDGNGKNDRQHEKQDSKEMSEAYQREREREPS